MRCTHPALPPFGVEVTLDIRACCGIVESVRAGCGVVTGDGAVSPFAVNIDMDVATAYFFLEDVSVPVDVM